MSVSTLLAVVLHSLASVATAASNAASPESPTDWSSISPHLVTRWSSDLPPVPAQGLNTSGWVPTALGEFQRIDAKLSEVLLCDQGSSGSTAAPAIWPARSITAGGLWSECGAAAAGCSGGITATTCRAQSTYNSREGMVLIGGKPGTHWAKATAQPAWIQFRFPKPTASASAEFRFEMDERYLPQAGGGNPCARAVADPAHNCSLCTTELTGDPWDHSVPPGLRMLWSYPGAPGHAIDPVPLDVYAAFKAGELNMHTESPAGVDLRGKDEVIVTMFAFNQYATYTNDLEDHASYDAVSDPAKCSMNWNKNTTADIDGTIGNYNIALHSASLVTRSYWNPPTAPLAPRPRLFGDDAEWSATAVQPFFDAPCTATAAFSPGFGGAAGVPDFKTAFEVATLGYASCHTTGKFAERPASILHHPYVALSYADPTFRSFTGNTDWSAATRVFHLLRRMKVCHSAGNTGSGGGPPSSRPCQFNATETAQLIATVITSEASSFDADARARNSDSWGWEQDSDGCCGYDLFTAAAFKHYAVLIDVLGGDIQTSNPTFYAALAAKMATYARDFVRAYKAGHWSLWNGNNWTPVLSEGALYWAITFWHEETELAREVIHIINDVGLLHLPMWLDDGTYKEGVCQYSVMSLTSSLGIAVLYARAFGEVWGSINTDRFAKGARWQLDSYDTAGYAIDFGDSHSCRGTTAVTMFAAYSAEVVAPTTKQGPAVISTVDPCVVREWSAMAYHLTVHDPWQFWPVLAAHDWGSIVAQCGIGGGNPRINPMGPGRLDVYEAYGSFKVPLLQECTAASAARFGCNSNRSSDTLGPPKLQDVAVYAHLAIQARPNEWPHSEVDFGTFKWTAWGQHLIGEFGYGTIGAGVNRYDGRRLAEIDNNPVGHNTIVIREAYPDGSDEINFSQLNFVAGSITKLVTHTGVPCVHLDGSDVYGASRANGWFQRMHRWACEVGTGGFIIIDSFAAQANRRPQAIYGAAYGGPNFAEPNRTHMQSELTVDEYFHTPSWLQGQVIAGWTPEAIAFKRSTAPKWCSHTDVDLVVDVGGGGGDGGAANRSSRAVLRSRCGEPYEEGDAVGEIVGWAAGGGSFVYDGLVSSTDRWGVAKLHQHRFRYEGSSTVGPSGDLRAFLMTTSVSPALPAPSWIQNCYAGQTPATCVVVCVGTQLYRFNVAPDGLTFDAADTGDDCDGANELSWSPTSSSSSPSPSPLPSLSPSTSPSPSQGGTESSPDSDSGAAKAAADAAAAAREAATASREAATKAKNKAAEVAAAAQAAADASAAAADAAAKAQAAADARDASSDDARAAASAAAPAAAAAANAKAEAVRAAQAEQDALAAEQRAIADEAKAVADEAKAVAAADVAAGKAASSSPTNNNDMAMTTIGAVAGGGGVLLILIIGVAMVVVMKKMKTRKRTRMGAHPLSNNQPPDARAKPPMSVEMGATHQDGRSRAATVHAHKTRAESAIDMYDNPGAGKGAAGGGMTEAMPHDRYSRESRLGRLQGGASYQRGDE